MLRGIWGFTATIKPHGDKLIQFGRQVPVISIVVDRPDRIARSFDIVDQVTGGHGLVTCEMVPALLVLDGGRREGSTDLADYRYWAGRLSASTVSSTTASSSACRPCRSCGITSRSPADPFQVSPAVVSRTRPRSTCSVVPALLCSLSSRPAARAISVCRSR